MKTLQIVVITLLIAIIGCKTESINPPLDHLPSDAALDPQEVNLENPRPGQQTAYIRYQSRCEDLEANFDYTMDTLLMTVMEINDSLFLEEKLTEGSTMFLDGTFTEPTRQPLIDENGSIMIPDREDSPLFFFYGNDRLTLNPEKTIPLYFLECRFYFFQGPFIGNDIGKIDKFSLGDIELDNKTVVSCLPEPLRIEAYLVYDENQLHMSYVLLSDTLTRGWVKLEEN